MPQNIGPMSLLCSIVERGKAGQLMEHYRKFGVSQHIQTYGRGTASSSLMDTFGFGTAERDILLSIAPKEATDHLIHHLKDDDRPKLRTPGIAFCFNLSGMSAVLAVCIARGEMPSVERGEYEMEQGNHHSLIMITVNPGFTDEVMDTARANGARGGTVIRARWTGSEEVQKFVGITLHTEKEVLAIVTPNKDKAALMEAIEKAHGLRTEAQATLISLPIDHTARLD